MSSMKMTGFVVERLISEVPCIGGVEGMSTLSPDSVPPRLPDYERAASGPKPAPLFMRTTNGKVDFPPER